MANIYKSALLILNEDQTKFLVNRKSKNSVMSQWLMPGGKIEVGETLEEALAREIKEELSCQLNPDSLEFLAEYEAPAAGQEHKTVNIKLYTGSMEGTPIPTSEIVAVGWVGSCDQNNLDASTIIRSQIIPDLIERGLLKVE